MRWINTSVILFALVFAIGVLGIFIYIDEDEVGSAVGVKIDPPTQADFYMRGTKTFATDADGKIAYQFSAKEILHYPNDDISIEDIKVNYLAGSDQQGGPWHAHAAEGYIVNEQPVLTLSGGVRLFGVLKDGTPVEMKSEQLVVRADLKRIESAVPVQLSGPGFVARADAMLTDFEARQLELTRNVTTNYDPN